MHCQFRQLCVKHGPTWSYMVLHGPCSRLPADLQAGALLQHAPISQPIVSVYNPLALKPVYRAYEQAPACHGRIGSSCIALTLPLTIHAIPCQYTHSHTHSPTRATPPTHSVAVSTRRKPTAQPNSNPTGPDNGVAHSSPTRVTPAHVPAYQPRSRRVSHSCQACHS